MRPANGRLLGLTEAHLAMIDCLTQAEYARLTKMRSTQPRVKLVLQQLNRILESRTFGRVQRTTRDFLTFVVVKTLIGQDDQVKELTVARRVFRESTDFDPVFNSKVRVAGIALRQRMAMYYAREGANDPLEIVIPTGTYTPQVLCRALRGTRAAARKAGSFSIRRVSDQAFRIVKTVADESDRRMDPPDRKEKGQNRRAIGMSMINRPIREGRSKIVRSSVGFVRGPV